MITGISNSIRVAAKVINTEVLKAEASSANPREQIAKLQITFM